MPVHNSEIAAIFNKTADLLEIKGSNPFRIRAYRNAARTIEQQSQSMAGMLEDEQDLTRLPDIGDDLAQKIAEIVRIGRLEMLHDLEQETPGELAELLDIAQLGPKRVGILHRELGITNISDLQAAAKDQKIRELDGFGKKTEETILKDIDRHLEQDSRNKLPYAEEHLRPLIDYLKNLDNIDRITVAGSYRRRQETVGDLDLLVTCNDSEPVMDSFVHYEDVAEVISQGRTRSSIRLRGGFQVDLRVVQKSSYGAALHYFTGSKQHNIAIRKIAVENDLKINEYGVFRKENKKKLAVTTEEEIYETLGLQYIEPELRENRGEIEAAQEKRLPNLIELDDIRGDLHAHTNATDGRSPLEEMVEKASSLGYSYLGITDHSQAVSVANGLDEKRLERQMEEIDRLSEQYSGFRILKGVEVDILKDGSLDLPSAILDRLDYTICSVHSHFGLSRDKQTERIIRAMDNPCCTIIGHPSGRLINERNPYAVDMEKLIAAAAERHCHLELNAHPDRLDLNDIHCRMARDMDVRIAINTDAHSASGLEFMRYGINQARRGWLEADRVINTRKVADLLKLFKR